MVPLKKHKFLVNIIGTFLIAAFIALIVRLGSVQITDHNKYAGLAKQQQSKKTILPARRGMILDRNGTKLAESLQLGSVCANPKVIKDEPDEQDEEKKDKKRKRYCADPAEIQDNITYTAHQLSKVLKLEPKALADRLKKGEKFVLIKRKVHDKDLDAVERLALKGIYVEREYHRFYPNQKLAAHVIGTTGDKAAGDYGIEKECNNTLTGKPGYKITGRDALQRPITTLDAEFQSPVHGEDVVLTIDAHIQRFTEEELGKACNKWAPLTATAIVMDPITAEVLALANYPTYDPNKPETYKIHKVELKQCDPRKNVAIIDSYEPGSIMKPLVVSGVLEQGMARPSDMIFCENGAWKINGHIMHDSHKHGNLTVTDIVAQSSNIGTGKLGLRMGKEKLYKLLKQYNFGEKTGIELPREHSGIFTPVKGWSKCSVENIVIGQGIAVTSLQFITAFCSIPNGGLLLRPTIIKSKGSNDDNTVKNVSGQKVVRRVMSERIARDVMNPILRKVVTDGTAKSANLLEYDIAGKTGTAQKVEGKGKNSHYSHTKFVGSFIAYAPADHPRVCVLVAINEPKNGAYYGSDVAAPVVREIIARTLFYMKVEPSQGKLAMQ